MRIQQPRTGLVQLRLGRIQALDVESIQPIDLAVLVGDQRGPVEPRLHGPAETDRIFEIAGVMPGIGHQLLGNATADDAGAADTVGFGDANLGAISGSNARRPHTARTGADNVEIVVEGRHYLSRALTRPSIKELE